tara:strand:- start:535 stop:1269 length:735 start_codon:yes stop_codon:yes gene_type:complete
MNVQPSDSLKYKLPQQQLATGGFLADGNFLMGEGAEKNITDPDYNPSKMVYEPTPLAAGPTHNSCAAGYITLICNLVLHLATALVTIFAAVAHFQKDGATKHLTPTHKNDYVSSWCIVMIAGEVVAVLFYVLWFGLVRRSFANPLPAILGGGVFFAVFTCTLKLTYYLSIGTMYTDPADGLEKNVNGIMHTAYEGSGLAQAALYLQCFVLASIIFTPASGTYFKVAQIENSVVAPIRRANQEKA